MSPVSQAPSWQHESHSWSQKLVHWPSTSVQYSIEPLSMNHRNRFSKDCFTTDASAGTGSFLHCWFDTRALRVREFSDLWSWAWSINMSVNIFFNADSISMSELEACKSAPCGFDLPVSPLLWGLWPSVGDPFLAAGSTSSCARSWACKPAILHNLDKLATCVSQGLCTSYLSENHTTMTSATREL